MSADDPISTYKPLTKVTSASHLQPAVLKGPLIASAPDMKSTVTFELYALVMPVRPAVRTVLGCFRHGDHVLACGELLSDAGQQ